MKISSAFALIAVSLLAAQADARDYQLEVGALAGAHLFSDSNGLGRHRGDSDDNAIQSSLQIGLRLAYVVPPYVALEGELALMPTTIKGDNPQIFAFGYRAHVLVHFLTGRFHPFALVGGG